MQESKSLSRQHQLALSQEIKAIHYLESLGHQILFHRFPGHITEIDIIAYSPQHILSLVEVKSSYPENLWTSRQLQKQFLFLNLLLETGLAADLYICYPIHKNLQLERIEP